MNKETGITSSSESTSGAGIKAGGSADEKLIEDYLKQVERNLKGFTREAKDSIIIEIDGHIREKIMEGGGGDDPADAATELLNGHEKQDVNINLSISDLLQDFGDPVDVAKAYEPVIGFEKRKILIFQGYSVFLTLFMTGYILFELLNGLSIQSELSRETLMVFAGICIISLSTILNVAYVKELDTFLRHYYLAILTNGILGLFFLFMVFEWSLEFLDSYAHLKGQFFDIYYDDSETNHSLARFGVFIFLGVPSFHVSYLGHSMMTKDTADGIAPLQNISFKLIPMILVGNIFLLYYVIRELNDTFPYFSKWNTNISYITLFFLIFLTVSLGSLMFLRKYIGAKTIYIQREVYIFMAIALILTSSIGSGLLNEDIRLREEWDKDRDDGNNYTAFDKLSWGLFYNGSMYSRDLFTQNDTYALRLNKWDKYLNSIVNSVEIPLDIDPEPYQHATLLSIITSGQYIHIWYQFHIWDEYDSESRDFDNYYILITFDGQLVNRTRFNYGSEQFLSNYYQNRMVAHERNATILFSKFTENETQAEKRRQSDISWIYIYNYLNLTIFSFRNGDLIGSNYSKASISLEDIDSRNLGRGPNVEFFPGPGSISIIFRFRTRVYMENDENHSYDNKFAYLTKISSNGTILLEPTLIAHEKLVYSGSYKIFGNRSSFFIINGFNNTFLMRIIKDNDEGMTWHDSYLRIIENTTNNNHTIIRQDVGIPHHESFWTLYSKSSIDDIGNFYYTQLDHYQNNSDTTITLSYYIVDPQYSPVKDWEIRLNDISFFRKAENNQGDYDGLTFSASTKGFFSNDNITYLFLEVMVGELVEGRNKRDPSSRIILIVDSEGLTYKDFGYDVKLKENKDSFYISMISGIILGLVIPGFLWLLIRKRGP